MSGFRMMGRTIRLGLGLALLASGAAAATATTGPAVAQGQKPGASGGGARALGELGSSREPISIDADRLDVYDKEGRAVFTGNVVAIQGDTSMKCIAMNVFYENKRGAAAAAGGEKPAASTGSLANDSAIKRIECKGPVVITTKTQTATGDRAEFDRVINKVFLIGNAALSDGPNVTRGERVAYDLNTGVANVEGGRVRALIVPGSDKPGGDKKDAKPKPRTGEAGARSQ